MRFEAVIFDMDGVLIDSEMEYIRLWKKLYHLKQIPMEEKDLYFLAGSAHHVEIDLFAEKMGISAKEAEKIRTAFFKRHPVDYKRIKKYYVDEILTSFSRAGMKIALASSSTFANIDTVLKQCGIDTYFSPIISGEMFEKTKPDPEIYLETIRRLDLEKEKIAVIEDSSYGIAAAKAAGLYTIAIEDPILHFDNSNADAVAKDLFEAERMIIC